MLDLFFQTLPIPSNQIIGKYSIPLVILSYLIGTAASYVALEITGRMRDVSISQFTSNLWLIGGSLAMGAGIWSMHFIGMLSFIMPVDMEYGLYNTSLSMVVAITASSIAFSLLRTKNISWTALALGGVILGFALAGMNYVGMSSMEEHMQIRYIPILFLLSIIIAIVASEAALFLAIKSSQPHIKRPFLFKICSAMIIGAALWGMHYTGMWASVFTPLSTVSHNLVEKAHDTNVLPMIIAIVAIFILAIAIGVSFFDEALSAKAVTIARQAGMTEVASSVLHNVGNVLTSVNVSSSLLHEHLGNIDLKKLEQVNLLLDSNKQDLASFITSEKGQILLGYLTSLAKNWQSEKQLLKNELKRLDENIQHIKGIITAQQSMHGVMNFAELISIEKAIEEALILTSIDAAKKKIKIEKSYSPLKSAIVDKLKLSQIIINLIQNAKDSVQESSNPEKMIIIKTGEVNKDTFFIQISDNGIGIDPANKSKLFSYGFTTKKKGHGLGLHSSIILSNEMGGTLIAQSEGINKGAVFTLEIPYVG